jgi:RimJ/RimL family protein N-acetyltransferase
MATIVTERAILPRMRDPTFRAMRTERLTIRRFRRDDAEAFSAYRGDPDVARYQSWDAFTRADADRFLSLISQEDPGEPGAWFQFAVEERATGQLVGDCALGLDRDRPEIAEIGYTLSRTARGLGYATEAAAAVLSYAHDRLGVRIARAVTDERNEASIRVAERLGMRLAGSARTWFKGERCVEVTYEKEIEGPNGPSGTTCACAPPRA